MKTESPPAISPVTNAGGSRPFWSVMVPAHRPDATFLRQTLESVLQQDPGPAQMEIQVVDDCSSGPDVAAMVKSIAGERIALFRTPKNLGLAGCWNLCIERSRGQWVHILHHDDYVLPGFYQRLAKAGQLHPEANLLSTRSFYVDTDGVIYGVTDRLQRLENGGCAVDDFFYYTPIQCPGVVVRRSFYESHGGFRPDLHFTLDREMWTRVISAGGGVVTPEVLCCYRRFEMNETARLGRTAEGLDDLNRLHLLFAARHEGFDYNKARRRVCYIALQQAERFFSIGDVEAAKANLNYWRRNAPVSLRLRHVAVKIARSIFK